MIRRFHRFRRFFSLKGAAETLTLIVGMYGVPGCEPAESSEGPQDDVKFVAAVAPQPATTGEDRLEARPTASKAMARSVAQWPEDGPARAKAMADRAERVAAAVNRACGTQISVLLNETGRGGAATGRGAVYIDFSLVWRLSEDALAVLVAHEFAHEVLGHAANLARLHYEGQGNPSYIQQVRELERQADLHAGGFLARTDYDPATFKELLAIGQDTEWSDARLRSYYPDRDRLKTLMEGYEARAKSERGMRNDSKSEVGMRNDERRNHNGYAKGS